MKKATLSSLRRQGSNKWFLVFFFLSFLSLQISNSKVFAEDTGFIPDGNEPPIDKSGDSGAPSGNNNSIPFPQFSAETSPDEMLRQVRELVQSNTDISQEELSVTVVKNS